MKLKMCKIFINKRRLKHNENNIIVKKYKIIRIHNHFQKFMIYGIAYISCSTDKYLMLIYKRYKINLIIIIFKLEKKRFHNTETLFVNEKKTFVDNEKCV